MTQGSACRLSEDAATSGQCPFNAYAAESHPPLQAVRWTEEKHVKIQIYQYDLDREFSLEI